MGKLKTAINKLLPALVGETHEHTLRRTIGELRKEREELLDLVRRNKYIDMDRFRLEYERQQRVAEQLSHDLRKANAENERLRAIVEEWFCVKCRYVYPGPPQSGIQCVICPRCGGDTMPRASAVEKELRGLLRETMPYLDHMADCDVMQIGHGSPCSCGLFRLQDTIKARSRGR